MYASSTDAGRVSLHAFFAPLIVIGAVVKASVCAASIRYRRTLKMAGMLPVADSGLVLVSGVIAATIPRRAVTSGACDIVIL